MTYTHSGKQHCFLTVVLVLIFFNSLKLLAQGTNPAPYNLSSSNFSLQSVPAGTIYPASTQGWQTTANNISTPELLSPAGDITLSGTSGASGAISNSTTNGFTFLSSGNGGGRRVGSICLSLNTTLRQSITLGWVARDYINSVNNNNMGLSIQYRIGTTGDFVDLGAANRFISTGAATSSQTFSNIFLPDSCNNKPVVQVRWIYYQITTNLTARDPIQLDNISVVSSELAICSGIPTPGNTLASSLIVNAGTTTNLSLQNVTNGLQVSYQWQSSTDSINWNNISGANAELYTATVSARTFYRCAVSCQSINTGFSNPVLININCSGTPAPGNTIASPNIIASGGSTTLSLQNNPMVVGLSYQWQSSSNNTSWTNISGANSSTYLRSGLTATTFFRCQVTCGGTTTNSTSVQVIIATCTGTPNPGNTIANPLQVVFGSNTSLSLQNVTVGTGVTYQWQQSLDSVTWSNITGATGATSARTITSNIYFRSLVTCLNNSRFSNPVFVRSLLCQPTSTTPSTYHIKEVKFRGVPRELENTSTFSSTPSGYQDFTGLSNHCKQTIGSGITVSVENNNQTAMIKAWVDWNKNNGFEPSELVYSTNGIGVRSTTFGFVVPTNIQPGLYRIRIRSHARVVTTDTAYTSCGNLASGESEDYLLEIIESCPAVILSASNSTACAGVPVTLQATASPSSSVFKWYGSEDDADPIAVTNVPSLLSPFINETKTYYLTAGNGLCESMERTPISAVFSKVPEMRFTPNDPAMCGERTVLRLDATGDIETAYLLNENFETGLGSFTVGNLITNTNALRDSTQWRIKTSTYVPNFTSVWRPAISSGLGSNKFVFATSDIASANISTVLNSPVINTNNFQSLFLDFSVYYSHYLPDDTSTIEDSLNIELSINGGTTWSIFKSFISDQGIGTQFSDKTLDLSAFINQANFRFRFKYRGRWVDGAALDDVRLYGDRPLTSTYSWSPLSGNNLYTDSACTIPYTGGSTTTIFFKPTNAQLDTGGIFTFNAVATLSNGCSTSAEVSVTVNPNLWTGAVNNDWNNPGNWCAGFVPTNITKVDIPINVPNFPTVNGTVDAKSVRILTGAKLTITEGGVLQVPGLFDNFGILENRGKIVLNGASPQFFPGNGEIQNMSSLEINNSGGGVRLNRRIFIENELIPTQGILNLDTADITLKSTKDRTASLTIVGTNAGFQYNTGRFVVERYIPVDTAISGHAKSWQFMAFPTSVGQTIKQAIQEGASLPNENAIPGYGTQVTGFVTNATDPSVGFDVYTRGGSTIKSYNPATNNWINITNTTNTPVYNKRGWYIFVRGDRSVINLSGNGSLPKPTTFRSRGRIYEPVSNPPEVTNVTAKLMESVANPYPCAIDFTKITKTGAILDRFWVWDPTLNTATNFGGFQLMTPAPGGGYFPTPGGTRNYPTGVPNSIIQSGGVFMVQAGSLNGTISFTEAAKVSGNRSMFRNGSMNPIRSSFQVQLIKHDEEEHSIVADGIHLLLEDESINVNDQENAPKMLNPSENLSIQSKEGLLTLQVLDIHSTDSVQLKLSQTKPGKYGFRFIPSNLVFGGEVILFDRYTNEKKSLRMNEQNDILFSINANEVSSSADRFVIYFEKSNKSTSTIASSTNPKQLNHVEIKHATNWAIYPNPVVGSKINLVSKDIVISEGINQIKVYDFKGVVVYRLNLNINSNQRNYTINLPEKLKFGNYILEIINKESVQQMKFILAE